MEDLTSRILWLERNFQLFSTRLSALEARVGALEQGAANLGYGGGPSGGKGATTMAVLTSSLASGSFASPATATANIYNWNGTAWIVGTGAQLGITVYSPWVLGSSIASGKKVGIFQQNGGWHVLTAEC